jgi:hypothetical protein
MRDFGANIGDRLGWKFLEPNPPAPNFRTPNSALPISPEIDFARAAFRERFPAPDGSAATGGDQADLKRFQAAESAVSPSGDQRPAKPVGTCPQRPIMFLMFGKTAVFSRVSCDFRQTTLYGWSLRI